MEPLEFTEQLVRDHYTRHCEVSENANALIELYTQFRGPDLNVRAPDGSGMYALVSWAAYVRDRDEELRATIDELVDVEELLAHFSERLFLMEAIKEAVGDYCAAYGNPTLEYTAGGITPDTIRLYSVPAYDHVMTMPVSWVAAHQIAGSAPGY